MTSSAVEDVKRDVMPLSQARRLAKKIWCPLLSAFIILLSMAPVSAITPLVVSENYGSGSAWTDKYFVPVITFLIPDVTGLIGRLISAIINTRVNRIWLCIFLFIRMLIYVPLIYLCNAQPRYFLPVVFPHDWQYALIVSISSFTATYVMNMVILDIPNGASRKSVSLSSLDNFGVLTVMSKEEEGKHAPKDKFYFVHILFLMMGLMHMIPIMFFTTANAYWMYKFRNTSADITDTDARTTLQTHFAPANTIVNSLFGPVTMVLSTFYGYKIKARVRVLAMSSIISLCFIAGTAFVKIDTDSWQLTFFLITVAILGTINVANSILTSGNFAVVSKFPHYYMKVYLIGEGMSGLCSSTLQIISLALGTSTEVSALFYFVCGSVLMILTLFLFYMSKYNKLYNYHFHSVVEDVKRDVMPLSEAMALVKKLWCPILSGFIMFLSMAPVIPNITSLVVSEHYGSGSAWTDTYFVPVITFLFPEIIGFLGRLLSAKIDKRISGIRLCIFLFIRMLIFVPLIYLCNAKPRHHLPLVFSHDWQYALILGSASLTASYIMNMIFLDIPRLVPPGQVEDAYLVMMSTGSLISVVLSPIGLFSVDIL